MKQTCTREIHVFTKHDKQVLQGKVTLGRYHCNVMFDCKLLKPNTQCYVCSNPILLAFTEVKVKIPMDREPLEKQIAIVIVCGSKCMNYLRYLKDTLNIDSFYL